MKQTLALVAALAAAPAHAQLSRDPLFPEPDRLAVSVGANGALLLPGSLRLVGGHVGGVAVASTDPAVDGETPDDDFLTARLRLRPGLVWTSGGFFAVYKAQVDADLDWHAVGHEVPAGLDHDPTWEARADVLSPRLTQAYVTAAGEWLALEAGLTRSAFGLGLVANPGEDPATGTVRESPFGFAREGDRLVRGRVTAFPLGLGGDDAGPRPPLAVAVAADAIVDDDTAVWADGDRAWQVLGGLFGIAGPVRSGAGVVYRRQAHAEGGDTEVWIGILTARYDALTEPVHLWAEAEVAGYTGTTTLTQSVLDPRAADILSAGGVLRLGGAWRLLEAVLEGGFASGDDNPVDREVHTFAFDREYRVGLLMFGEMARLSSAVAAHDIDNPTFRAEPPRGYEAVATEGAVQNALYLNPRVAVRPLDGFTLTLGYLYAVSEEPYADPYRSTLAGGAAVGPRGAAGERGLGHEVDLGAEYEVHLRPVRLRARAQFAWFDPGPVFDTAEGGEAPAVTGLWAHLEAFW